MAIDLAVALAAIATRALVSELIKGVDMSRDTWAAIGSEVAGTLVSSAIRPDTGAQRLAELGRQIGQVSQQIDDLPNREFEKHMAAGRRYMRDLPVEWRTKQDRRELIRDARHEFVTAVALAENMGDVRLQAVAEVAIAACWLWVPSLQDVKNTAGHARRVLENEILFGSSLPTAEYADVIKLCRAYGERPKITGIPIAQPSRAPTPGARLAVHAKTDTWVECAGVRLRFDELTVETVKQARPAIYGTPEDGGGFVLRKRPTTPLRGWPPSGSGATTTRAEKVTVTVHNTRTEWVSVSATARAVIVQVASNNTLPNDNRVKPGAKAKLTLTKPRPTALTTTASQLYVVRRTTPLVVRPAQPLPVNPTIGFILPG